MLVCPSGNHYLWVGSTFQVPSASSPPVAKKKTPSGTFDDLSDDGMDVCGTMSRDDKEIIKWARQIDNSPIVCKNKVDMFKPDSISIQR